MTASEFAGEEPAASALVQRLFSQGRTHSHWLPQSVPSSLLHEMVALMQLAPTSMNSQPLRLQFVVSEAAKERLVACVNPGNVAKTRSAPVVAIIGHDLAFPDLLPRLFAHKADARNYYQGKPEFTAASALRNGSLQGAFLMLAARCLGLDCGPMSGFNVQAVDEAFWAGTSVQTNFLCNLGYGDAAQLKPRPPRLGFDEVCRLI